MPISVTLQLNCRVAHSPPYWSWLSNFRVEWERRSESSDSSVRWVQLPWASMPAEVWVDRVNEGILQIFLHWQSSGARVSAPRS